MSYTFLDLAIEVLKMQNAPMSVTAIWEKAKELNLVKDLPKYGKTPEKTLGARIYVSIKQDGKDSPFSQVSKRPALFVLKEQEVSQPALAEIATKEDKPFHERALHKILSSFVYSDPHFECYTKTIYHELSKKGSKGKNKWLHPDIVGVHYPFDDFSSDTRQLMQKISNVKCKIYSFELKKSVDFSNLREYFFQAVSNSSWANEGYLVALNYDQNPDFIDELRRLNNAFGIGFIKLNIDKFTQSEVILTAKENEVDWETVDRLCEENDNFKTFIHNVTSDISGDEMRTHDFDEFFITDDDDEYQKYIKEKRIK
jgi:hypothetical protein